MSSTALFSIEGNKSKDKNNSESQSVADQTALNKVAVNQTSVASANPSNSADPQMSLSLDTYPKSSLNKGNEINLNSSQGLQEGILPQGKLLQAQEQKSVTGIQTNIPDKTLSNKSFAENIKIQQLLSVLSSYTTTQILCTAILATLSITIYFLAQNLSYEAGGISQVTKRSVFAWTAFLFANLSIIVSILPLLKNTYEEILERTFSINLSLLLAGFCLLFVVDLSLLQLGSLSYKATFTQIQLPVLFAFIININLYLTKVFKKIISTNTKSTLYPRADFIRLLENKLEKVTGQKSVSQKFSGKSSSEIDFSKETLKNPADAKLGDVHLLKEGDLIPLDSKIIQGSILVAEKRFSLAPKNILRTKAQRVYAGSKVLKGECVCIVENLLNDCDLSIASQYCEAIMSEPLQSDISDYKTQKTINSIILISAICVVAFSGWFDITTQTIAYVVFTILSSVTLSLAFCSGFALRRQTILRIIQEGFVLKSAELIEKISKINQCLLDFAPKITKKSSKIVDYRFIKSSLNESEVFSKLLHIASQSKNRDIQTLSDGLLEKLSNHKYSPLKLYESSVFSDIEDGVGAVIGEETLILGQENCLLNHGVFLQSSDVQFKTSKSNIDYQVLGRQLVGKENNLSIENKIFVQEEQVGSKVLYSSINGEVVASFLVEQQTFPHNKSEILKLKTTVPLKVSLISDQDKKIVDLYGKSIGLDLASIHSAPTLEEFDKKISTFKASCFFSDRDVKRVKQLLTISHFDPVIREYEQADITSFNDDINNVPSIFSIVKNALTAKESLFFTALVATLLSFLAAVYSPIVGAVFVISSFTLFTLIQYTLLGVFRK